MYTVSFPGIGIGPLSFYPYFTFFGIKIYWYGVLIAIGMLAALCYGIKRAKEFGIDVNRMLDVVLIGILGGIIGARIYYCLFSWRLYVDAPWTVFDIRSGGLAIFGGIIGAVVSGYFACRWRKVPFYTMLDIAGLGLLLGQAIGRWGNFFNVEAYGGHTDLPWGMTSPQISSAALPVHPTFLYESLWCLLGFILLSFYVRRRKFDGEIFLLYLAWYGLERFFVEGLRTDSLWLVPNFIRISQLIAGAAFIISLGILLYQYWRIHKNPAHAHLYVNEIRRKEKQNDS